jgi:hypothetical protein
MRLPHCAIGISFSMSCQRRELSLRSQSGSGEHVVHCARNLPRLVFQPSDPDPDARLRWVKATGVTNVRAPFDALRSVWPIASADGIICINMSHISPWEATVGLIKGRPPYSPPRSPIATASGNQAFDRSLRDRNPNWGLRELQVVAATAQSAGFSAPAITEMPANNLSVVFRRV